MRVVRAGDMAQFGTPYVLQARAPRQQAIPRRLTEMLVDVPMYVGQRPAPWWRQRSPWREVAYFLIFICILIAAVHAAGGGFDL